MHGLILSRVPKLWESRSTPATSFGPVHLVLVGAMGPPGGGRNAVSNRVLRHFNFVAYPEVDAGHPTAWLEGDRTPPPPEGRE